MECVDKTCIRSSDCGYLDIFKKQPLKERQCSYHSKKLKKQKEDETINLKKKKLKK